MKLIPLSKNNKNLTGKYFAIVDDDMYDYLMGRNWFVRLVRGKPYVYSSKILLHREVMGIMDSKVFIDHKDRNGLNCQKGNLRICTNSQNQANKASRPRSSSKYLGVHWHKNGNKWRAKVKNISLGLFEIEEDAARAYDAKAKEIHGEFANLNFR